MAVTTDGDQAKSTFDPDAPCVARDGLSYKCFADRIRGRPDPDDPTNPQIERLVKAGRSEAFCREYRVGYERAGLGLSHWAGLVNAEEACPEESANAVTRATLDRLIAEGRVTACPKSSARLITRLLARVARFTESPPG